MSTQTPPRPPAALGDLSTVNLTMLLVVLIWGANFAIVKGALGVIPPLAFVALRFVGATLLLVPLMLIREGWPKLPRGSWPRLVTFGIVGNTLYQPLFMLGLARTTSANSSLILAATPVLIALFGSLLGIERVTRRLALSILLSFSGITLVLTARGATLSGETLLGDLLVVGATCCWSVYTLGLRTLRGVSNLQVTALTLLTGTPGLLILGVPALVQLDWSAVGASAWWALGYATVLAIVVAYILWNNSVRVAGSTRTSIFQCMTPLVAALVAWWLLGEHLVWLQAVGAALIIAGLLVATLRKR